ncbi:MAG: hypothetical protein KA004_17410 [Verrucomicrobiales bacterium]|nr:hypothetical protein [Verrucomicrobiales bacterium]
MIASAVLTAHAKFDPEDLVSGFDLGILADARVLNADEALARTYDSEGIAAQTVEIGFTTTAAIERIPADATGGGLANGARTIRFAEFTALVIRLRKKWPDAGVFGGVDVTTLDLGYDLSLSSATLPDLHFRDFGHAPCPRDDTSAFEAQFHLPSAGDALSITGDASTDLITATGHVWCEGLPLALSGLTGGTGLANGNYYLRDLQADGTFKLTDTLGGTPVDFTSDITAGSLVPRFANLLLDFVLFGNR